MSRDADVRRRESRRLDFQGRNFFSIQQFFEAEKINMAALSFDGQALAWFQWEDRRRRMRSWNELESRLLDRFGSTQEGSLYERFLALRQEGSMTEFH